MCKNYVVSKNLKLKLIILYFAHAGSKLHCPSNKEVALKFKKDNKLYSTPHVTSLSKLDKLGKLGSNNIARACAECHYQITLPNRFVEFFFNFFY